ncbi:MAG: hypothetical protein WCX31_02015 [Salinivirgaceae bacterium]
METSKSVAVIVAHPDDETLWAGGTLLNHPEWRCFIVSLCRGNDLDRAPKFYKTMKILNATGMMGELDDGPEQVPLDEKLIESTILHLLPSKNFDLIITHNPMGEYTRHIRHEEIGLAVANLWRKGELLADELWTFAYGDNNKEYYPKANENATIFKKLPETIWKKKYQIITETYGYNKNSWEAKTTPKAEAFQKYTIHSPLI